MGRQPLVPSISPVVGWLQRVSGVPVSTVCRRMTWTGTATRLLTETVTRWIRMSSRGWRHGTTAQTAIAMGPATTVDGDGYDADAYGGADCDDSDGRVYPSAIETWYDGTDSGRWGQR